VNISVPKMRLFVGNIPKTLKKEEIFSEFATLTGKFTRALNNSLIILIFCLCVSADLKEVIYYSLPGNKSRNRFVMRQKNIQNCLLIYEAFSFSSRGFCFLDYETHQAASAARRQLDARRVNSFLHFNLFFSSP